MIEATCSACGTLNRIAESDVPMGAKFVNCASCKSRVVLPGKTATPAIPSLPKVPAPARPSIESADILDLSDLPAPKRQSALGPEASKPAPKSALASALEIDLPAPKRPSGGGHGGPPPSIELDDLMPPQEVSDLLAPKAPKAGAPAPRPASDSIGITDLPTPKAPARPGAELSVPKSSAPIIDLPAPKMPAAKPAPGKLGSALPPRTIEDLPTPRIPGRAITDLPTPKVAAGVTDLPMPKAGSATDLLTPKGPSATGGIDLPAPKGFFDDLPQPARTQPPAVTTDEIAPKGFFDDLPQPARPNQQKPTTDDIAPKGFFDDLPGRTTGGKSSQELTPAVKTEDIAPKGFFDDLPQPRGRGDDSATASDALMELDLAPSDDGDAIELSVDSPPATTTPPKSGAQFDDLDLSQPTASPIRFDPPQKRTNSPTGAPASMRAPIKPLHGGAESATLELEEPKSLESSTAKLAPRKPKEPVNSSVEEAIAARAKRKRTRLIGGIALGLALLGGGGFMMYRRHAAAKQREDEVAEHVQAARRALTLDEPNHWQRASTAAQQALELDDKNAEALGLAAEASIASALADGKGAAVKLGKGRAIISDALGAGITGPELDRAQAVASIPTNPANAVTKLGALLAKSPKDGALALYLGWAQAANGDPTSAIKSFDQAITNTPAVKLPALYARGRAKLALADVEGAKTDFNAVLAIDKDNIPAMVGLAAARPQPEAQQQESDLLAILARKDVATSDPRAIAQAWILAADDARRGGRLDAARERYRKALDTDPHALDALTGLAEVELRDNKIDAAAEQVAKALAQSKDDAHAQLVQAEVSIRQSKVDPSKLGDAEARIKALADRTPPLPPLDQARLHLVSGKLAEAQGHDQAAVDAYIQAAKLAGDFDLTPTMAAVAKLTEMATKATEAKDAKRAQDLHDQSDALLSSLADKAKDDPQLAMTLGMAYQQSGDPAKAESWLRRVVVARPKDADAAYQLGKALAKLGRTAEAIDQLKAAMTLSQRQEIGLELARTYEQLARLPEAGQLYIKLLAMPEPTLELRTYAGRFFARTGQIDKAAEQGAQILEVDHHNAAGSFLKAEGLLAAGKIDDARKLFTEAVTAERDPLYLDGQGRATEQLAQLRNDLGLQDAALRAYIAANELDATMFNPLLGMGRLYVARQEAAKAVVPLLAARKLREDDPEVPYLLGVAYQLLGEKKAAVGWLQTSVAMKPRAEASWRLGQLYVDPDVNQPGPAQNALSAATRLALDEEKVSGGTIPWLTDALHALGQVAYDNHDEASAHSAWEKYVQRNPRPGAKLDEVRRHLATDLRR